MNWPPKQLKSRKRSGFMTQGEHLAFNVGCLGASLIASLLMHVMRQYFPHPAQAPTFTRFILGIFSFLMFIGSFFVFYVLALWCMGMVGSKNRKAEKKPQDKDD